MAFVAVVTCYFNDYLFLENQQNCVIATDTISAVAYLCGIFKCSGMDFKFINLFSSKNYTFPFLFISYIIEEKTGRNDRYEENNGHRLW